MGFFYSGKPSYYKQVRATKIGEKKSIGIEVTSLPNIHGPLTVQVTVLDQETSLVNWTVHHDQQVPGLEIVYSPVRSKYGCDIKNRVVVIYVNQISLSQAEKLSNR